MQLNMFEHVPTTILGDRDGQSFSRKRDGVRLNKQAQDVFDFMSVGCWSTLREISKATGHPEASVSARLRDLKKSKFGGYLIEKRNLGGGLWQYHMGERQ